MDGWMDGCKNGWKRKKISNSASFPSPLGRSEKKSICLLILCGRRLNDKSFSFSLPFSLSLSLSNLNGYYTLPITIFAILGTTQSRTMFYKIAQIS